MSKTQITESHKRGRKSKYDATKLPEVLELASRNESDAAIGAKVFGCSAVAFCSMKAKHLELLNALKDGRREYYDTATPEVIDSLRDSAIGKSIIEEGTVTRKNGDVVQYVKHAPPNVAAQIFWLVNASRRKAALLAGVKDVADWEQTQRFEHTGKDGGPLDVTTTVVFQGCGVKAGE